MEIASIIAIVVIILNILFCFSLIFIERQDPTTTWAWLLIMIILPGIGFLFYLLLGQNLSRQKIFKEKIITDEMRKKELNNENIPKCDLNKIDKNFLDLRRMNYNHCGAQYTTGNEVTMYVDGEDKFRQLKEDLKNAKRYINIQYYIFRRDNIGKEIIQILEEKLEEGVEVRFLVDSMGSYKLTKRSIRSYIKKGGKFEIFFPGILPHINTRINYRNHRKMVIIDGEIGYTGGFNVGKEYINEDKKIGFWRDTHIRIRGKAVNDLNERFLLDWCYASGEEIDDFSVFNSDNVYNEGSTGIQIVTSGPDHKEEYIKIGYIKMINNAKKNVYLETPYFVPDEPMLEALKISALSGVDVRIIIPGNPDHMFMEWAASAYIGELLEAGVRVYYYQNGFIHAKTIVCDGSVATIGTANMDIRSYKLNFEVNAFLYDRELALEMEEQFFRDIDESELITKEEYNNRSNWMKIKESIIRLVSPIL